MSRLFIPLVNQVRYYFGKKPPKHWVPEGVKYGLVTYYPRHPNHQDPPITPTKTLMIQRVKPYKGNPWWHKEILDKYKLNNKISDVIIVKNTPEVCAELWKIKHIIKVTPIKAPEQLPDENTCSTYLHEYGDLLIGPKIDAAREQATNEFINDRKRLDRPTLNDELRKRWNTGWNL